MEPIKVSKITERLLIVGTVLIFISGIVIFVSASATKAVKEEIRELEFFLENAEGFHESIERALRSYTEETQEIMDHLLSLRLKDQGEYIEFIRSVEELGEEMGVNLRLSFRSMDQDAIQYRLEISGDFFQLKEFTRELKKLGGIVMVTSVRFIEMEVHMGQRGSTGRNIEIDIKVHIKENGNNNN